MSEAKTSMEILESVMSTRTVGVKNEHGSYARAKPTGLGTPQPATLDESATIQRKVGELKQRLKEDGRLPLCKVGDAFAGASIATEEPASCAHCPEVNDCLTIAKSSTDAFDLLADLKDGEAFKAVTKLSIAALKMVGEPGCEIPSPKLIKQLRKGNIRKIKMVDLLNFFYANGSDKVSFVTAVDLNPPIKYHPETGKRILLDSVTLNDIRISEHCMLCLYNPWTGKRRCDVDFTYDPFAVDLKPPVRLKVR